MERPQTKNSDRGILKDTETRVFFAHDSDLGYKNILKSYKDNDYFIFIGFLNCLKIGYIVGRTVHDELNIYNLAILEKYRNKGFASKLLCYIFGHLGREINSVYVEVRETNFQALNLYRKFGFIEYNIRENYYSFPTENAILMQYKFQSE